MNEEEIRADERNKWAVIHDLLAVDFLDGRVNADVHGKKFSKKENKLLAGMCKWVSRELRNHNK